MIGFIHSYIERMNVSYFALPTPDPTFLPLVHTQSDYSLLLLFDHCTY